MLRAQEPLCTSGTQATSAVKRLDLREYFKRPKQSPGGALGIFLGGGVPLEICNPYPIPDHFQVHFATLS